MHSLNCQYDFKCADQEGGGFSDRYVSRDDLEPQMSIKVQCVRWRCSGSSVERAVNVKRKTSSF